MSTIIEITDQCYCKVISENDKGIKTNKHISISTLLKLLQSATTEKDIECENSSITYSEILPGDSLISTIQIKEMVDQNAKWYMLLRDNKPATFKFQDRNYKNVGMPKLLFAIKVFNNKCVNIRIAAVKTDKITEDTKIYKYPFSNVSDTRNVCLGNNTLSDFDLKSISNISMIPEIFLSMPNNKDMYSGSNNSQLQYE